MVTVKYIKGWDPTCSEGEESSGSDSEEEELEEYFFDFLECLLEAFFEDFLAAIFSSFFLSAFEEGLELSSPSDEGADFFDDFLECLLFCLGMLALKLRGAEVINEAAGAVMYAGGMADWFEVSAS